MFRNIYWFSMFMSWFFIRIILIVTWTWINIFGTKIIYRIIRRFTIILCVILIFLCFRFSNPFFNILSNFIIFLDYLLYWMMFLESSITELCCLVIKQSYLFMWCDNRTFEWFGSTVKCWIIILYIRLNVNWSRWMLRHG